MADLQPIEPRLLKGFRDTLPDRLIVRNHIINRIAQVATRFGFSPLETPALEYAEILEGKLGDEGEKLLYKFVDHGGRSVAMRYDFTVPLARVVAQYPELPKPFKRYQVGPVWRADNTQRGRYREFYQFDLDITGTNARLADAEILVLIQELLLALNIQDFQIRVSDRKYIAVLADEVNLNAHQRKALQAALDKWDKIGEEAVYDLWYSSGLSTSQVDHLKQAFQSSRGQEDLQKTLDLAISMGLKSEVVKIDPTIIRGLDYYTGIVYETVLTNAPEFGSIFSGGRYDGLVGRFSKQPVPAVGASVGLDRLVATLEHLQLLPDLPTSTQVFITVFNEDLLPTSNDIARQFRQSGINTEISYQAGSIGKQLKQADSKSIPFAIIIGPDEASNKKLTLRNLANGEEQQLTADEAIRQLQKA